MRLKLKNTEKYLKAYTKELLKLTIKELDRDDRIRNYNSQTITSKITASGSLKESLNIYFLPYIPGIILHLFLPEGRKTTSEPCHRWHRAPQNPGPTKSLYGSFHFPEAD